MSSAGELMTRPLTVTRPCVIHLLGIAARGEARTRQHLGDALAGLLRLRRLFAARAAFEITLARAIGAAAAEGRTLLEDPALVLVFTARTIAEAAFAARMLVPVGAALGALARAIEFRTVTAAPTTVAIAVTTGPIELGTVLTRAIELGPLAERTIARRTIVARTREARTVVAAATSRFCQGLSSPAVTAAEILARAVAEVLARSGRSPRARITAIALLHAALNRCARRDLRAARDRRAPRKLPLAVELAFRTSPRGA